MIQRKQSLLLFQVIFLGISLIIIPVVNVTIAQSVRHVSLFLNQTDPEITTSTGHLAATLLNFVAVLLSLFTLLQFKKLALQHKLSRVIAIIYISLTLMILFCPFIELKEGQTSNQSYLAAAVGLVAAFGAWQAGRFIKKDIELLKSVDRIR